MKKLRIEILVPVAFLLLAAFVVGFVAPDVRASGGLKDHPPLVARLRQRTSPHEADIALQALLRRDDLDPVARVDLFAEIAGHFKRIVSFPEEVMEGISDEQFIRNVVEVLFISR